MINYEYTKSSIFDSNKKYCEEIETKLRSLNIECLGFCNCYGYDIEATFTKDNLTYNIKYHKHQTTQNGIVLPFDAIEYAGIEVTVTGLNKKHCMKVGKSSFRRFFCSNEIKSKFTAPYFIQSNCLTDYNLICSLFEKFRDNNISTITLRKGKLVYAIHAPVAEPQELITDTKNIITSLS